MLQYILRGVCRLNNRPYRVHHPLWNYYTIKMSMSGIINNTFEVDQQTSKYGFNLVTRRKKSILNSYSTTKVMLQNILRGVCRLNNRPYRVHHPLWNYYTIKMSMSGIINNAFEVNQQTSKCGSAMQFSTPNELSWQHNYLPGHKIYKLGQ